MTEHEEPVAPEEPAPSGEFDIRTLEYDLPEELIAQHPAPARERARLLVVEPGMNELRDLHIPDLPGLLAPGDLLVLNDTKVLPAKFVAHRTTGGVIEGLYIHEEKHGLWRVMLKGAKRLREGETLTIASRDGGTLPATVAAKLEDGHWHLRIEAEGSVEEILGRFGRTPLPPYIRRDAEQARQHDADDRLRYQTVFAREPGAVAAPTAGLHLTASLLEAVRARGVEIAYVTLHVGIGTFKPISTERLADHLMHEERYDLSPATADAVRRCRAHGGRVVAVGTTSVRVLESAADGRESRTVLPKSGITDIFIYPPYEFRVVDVLLTNFHLPKSTLLALVMAFAGIEPIHRAYRHAIARRYRFFSYGDAMLLLKR